MSDGKGMKVDFVDRIPPELRTTPATAYVYARDIPPTDPPQRYGVDDLSRLVREHLEKPLGAATLFPPAGGFITCEYPSGFVVRYRVESIDAKGAATVVVDRIVTDPHVTATVRVEKPADWLPVAFDLDDPAYCTCGACKTAGGEHDADCQTVQLRREAKGGET